MESKKRLIAYIEKLNQVECLPYSIIDGVALNKKVVINKNWQDFLADNYVTISGWIEMKKVRYLQNRNPGVPGIIYKIAPENDRQRKLKYVRELWNTIIDVTPVYDIYTHKTFTKNNFDVDHFVPWSLEELYVPECDKQSFVCVLEKNLRNIYDSAKMQGYEIWNI